MSELNIPLLRKAVEWVEEQDKLPAKTREWMQQLWVANEHWRTQVHFHESGCGTGYCLAGYVGHLMDSRYSEDGWVHEVDGKSTHVSEYAKQQLGLTQEQANLLFSASNSAADIRRIAEEITGQKL